MIADQQENRGRSLLRQMGSGGRLLSGVLALAALSMPLGFVSSSAAAPAEVTEFHLPPGDFYPGKITAGPDGNLWFVNTSGQLGQPAYSQHYETVIDRVTPSGQISEFKPPSSSVSAIAAGPNGAVWYLSEGHVGQVTPAGQFTEFPLVRPFSEGGIVTGSDGNLWTTNRDDSHTDEIVRIAPSGQISEFPLPHRESGPHSIALGPDGNVWFTELFGNRIGRITPSGRITELPFSRAAMGIVTGPDGNLWYTSHSGVGRITPSGKVREFPVTTPPTGPIAVGSDGRLWFPDGPGKIGRITPTGRVSQIRLPVAGSYPTDLALGREGDIWYTAAGDRPCEGGGVTCQEYVPKNSGMFGRIAPGPLAVEFRSARALATHRWVRVRLACEGGNAGSVCSGVLRLSLPQLRSTSRRGNRGGDGAVLGGTDFRLRADEGRSVAIRLDRRASALLAHRHPLRVTATVSSLSTGRTRESILIQRRPRNGHKPR